jgi:hypothetical protein
MTKDPVHNFLKGLSQQRNSSSPVIFGSGRGRPSGRYVIQPVFSSWTRHIDSDEDILNMIHNWPRANDVLVDSSFFSPVRIDLNRRLLLKRPVLLIRAVQDELNTLKLTTNKETLGQLASILFDATGGFNRSFNCASEKWIRGYEYPIMRYLILLRLRRSILKKPLRTFEKHEGRRALGKDLSRLKRQALSYGISQETLRLAKKGGEEKSYADEWLSVEAVLRPIIVGRDCSALTADRHVFDQIVQFAHLLFTDYGSFLIAQDFARNPDRYTHRHEISTPAMKPGAIAIGRVSDPDYLLPRIFRMCAVCVINVTTRDVFSWVCMREMEQMLDFQSRSADGRTADGGNGLNVHISLGFTPNCRDAQAHFVLGEDRITYNFDFQGKIGRIRISCFDHFRTVSDSTPTDASDRRIWMPGRPVPRYNY